jgi:hypothetical protein
MSRSDLLLFEAIAGSALDAFGYERSELRPSRVERLRTEARGITSDVRRRVQPKRSKKRVADG